MESQNHLRDAVDKEYITEGKRAELDQLASIALGEVTRLVESLQSEEALQKARRAPEGAPRPRAAHGDEGNASKPDGPGGRDGELRTQNSEPRT